jgi:Coenzyme PQQ synthesis protein D (PqqD)
MAEQSSEVGGKELRPDDDVVARRLEDEVVLVHLRTNRIYTLNETGARFWELLGEGRDRAEIERQLLHEFEVEPEQLKEELERTVSLLSRERLVTLGERS